MYVYIHIADIAMFDSSDLFLTRHFTPHSLTALHTWRHGVYAPTRSQYRSAALRVLKDLRDVRKVCDFHLSVCAALMIASAIDLPIVRKD